MVSLHIVRKKYQSNLFYLDDIFFTRKVIIKDLKEYGNND